tara:strand:+ start:524 stop:700 length:177 start_codon:yes stop_codon:yes gene_type:complete
MIKIVKNENFPKWVQIFAFNNFVEEIESKNKALRIAKKIAKENNINFLYFLGDIVSTD